VVDLELPRALRQSLQTTNLIESPFPIVRQVARNVKRWRNGGKEMRTISKNKMRILRYILVSVGVSCWV